MATRDVSREGVDRTTEPRRRLGRTHETETKASFKTTEFIAYVVVLAGVLIAALLVDGGEDGGVGFGPKTAWLLATLLTIGYMVSRGLAKSGSRDPYSADDDH